MNFNKAGLTKAVRYGLLVLILCTLVFIFANSIIPTKESAEISDGVGGFLAEIIPPDTTFGAFLQKYLRKIAHFTEYGLLGIEIALYVFFFFDFDKKRKYIPLSAFVPFLVGFTDESIQLISKRGASVFDVWIDVGGYIFFSLIAYAILFGVRYIAHLIKN